MMGGQDTPRPSTGVLRLLMLGLVGLAAVLVHAHVGDGSRPESRSLVRALGLTDLALFTDARYARNPALADIHAPFQDTPLSLEHFPSGSFMPVPPHFGSGPLGGTLSGSGPLGGPLAGDVQ